MNDSSREMIGGKMSDEKQSTLPFWTNIERTAPASIVRSALFGIVKRGTRRFINREIVAAWGTDSIRFTGSQLDQADFDLWLEILHQSREQLGKPVYFTHKGILEAIGRAKGGKNIEWLQKSLTRLKATEVLIKSGSKKYAGSFMQSYAINSVTEEYYLSVDKQIGELFDPTYGKMLLDVRLSLSTDLSRWLYAFISSQKPRRLHTIGIEKLKALSGSSSTIRKFRYMLKRDLPILEKENILDHWYIRDSDVLEYRRKQPISGV